MMLDSSQIVEDLAPMSRLEGDVLYRGYSSLVFPRIFTKLRIF